MGVEQDNFILKLKKDGLNIGKQAEDGNIFAKKVMEQYTWWAKCPGDNMAFILCEKAYDNWKDKNKE